MTRSSMATSLQCGQNVFMVCGLQVESVTFLRHVNGRCLVSWGNGGTSVNQSRLFLTEDEARQHLPAQLNQASPSAADHRSNSDHRDHTDFIWGMEEPYEPEHDPYESERYESDGDLYKPEYYSNSDTQPRAQSWRYGRIDEPGDGWARNATGMRTSRNGKYVTQRKNST